MRVSATARRPLATLGVALFAVVLSACQARQADVHTNTISAAQPAALHTQSNTASRRWAWPHATQAASRRSAGSRHRR